jgi:hypothetical protein
MAQVDLGSKRNSHQSLAALAEMSREVIAALAARLGELEAPGTGAIEPAPGIAPRLSRRPPLAELLGSRAL